MIPTDSPLFQYMAIAIISMTALFCFVVIGFDEFTGHPIDNTTQSLLSFIIGILTTAHIGSLLTNRTTAVAAAATAAALQQTPSSPVEHAA